MLTINFHELKFLGLLKYRSKSFEILQTCCKIHAISFFETCQSILDFLNKKMLK
jgi:hypothetical protein